MDVKGIVWTVGRFLYMLSAIIAIGLGVSLYFQEAAGPFCKTILLTLFAAVLCDSFSRGYQEHLGAKEAIVSVALIWLAAGFFCSLPFYLSQTLPHPVDALFESISGLTTTCSTAIEAKIETVSSSLLFWRSFLCWIGGAGIILLIVAILPAFGDETKKLFRFESTGMQYSPILPRARQSALVLFSIYFGLTLLCYLLLRFTNGPFISLNLALTTISTGGFMTFSGGITNWMTELVLTVFMLLGAITFSCHYYLFKGWFFKLKNPELIGFFTILALFSALVSLNLYTSSYYGAIDAVRHGTFQVVSALTTTGYFTVPYNEWPNFSQAMLLISSLFGGMSGSTAGGLKIIRVLILWQCLRSDALTIFTRHEVRVMTLFGKEIERATAYRVLTFFLVLVFTAVVGLLCLLWDGTSLETSCTLSIGMLNNGGTFESCSYLSPFSKCICMLLMLLGRLEFYVWLALFAPSFWKNR